MEYQKILITADDYVDELVHKYGYTPEKSDAMVKVYEAINGPLDFLIWKIGLHDHFGTSGVSSDYIHVAEQFYTNLTKILECNGEDPAIPYPFTRDGDKLVMRPGEAGSAPTLPKVSAPVHSDTSTVSQMVLSLTGKDIPYEEILEDFRTDPVLSAHLAENPDASEVVMKYLAEWITIKHLSWS